MLAEAERAPAFSVVKYKLNPEDIQEQLVHFVAREDLTDHADNVGAVRAVQAGHIPAVPLLLTLLIHPTPIRVAQHALVVELQAVVTNHGHAELAGE